MTLQTARVHISETDCREKKMSEKFFLNRLCQLFLPGCIFFSGQACVLSSFCLPSETAIDLGIPISQYTVNSRPLSTVPSWLY